MTVAPAARLRYFLLKTLAMAELALGHLPGALAAFDRMLLLCPLDRHALASRAHALARLGRLDESIGSQLQLVRLDGSPAQLAAAWFNLGYVLQQAGRYEEAQPAFEQATAHDPGMDRAWYGLALVLMRQRQFHAARRALEKNTALQPLSPHGWYRLAEVGMALGEPEQARQALDHLRQFEPRVAAQLQRDMRLRDCAHWQTLERNGPARNAGC